MRLTTLADTSRVPQPEIDALIDDLSSCHRSVREAAQEALAARRDECAGALVRVLDEEAGRMRARRRGLFAVCLAAIAIQCLLILSPFGLWRWTHRTIEGNIVMLVLRVLSQSGLLLAALGGASLRHRGAAGVLAKCDDLHLVGPLIEAGEVNPAAHEVLTRLLPMLKAPDAGLIDRHQRKLLNQRLLTIAKRPDDHNSVQRAYTLAILKCLEQVGDGDSVAAVTQAADGKPCSFAGEQVRDAACACLPFLLARAKALEPGGTLLRPAAGAKPEGLLRPAMRLSGAPPEQMVRPAQEPAEY